MVTVTLRGRDDELRRVQQVVAAVCARRSALLALEGAAGMGKTALLDAVLTEHAADPSLRIVRVRADDRATTVPFGLFADLVPAVAPRPASEALPDQGARLVEVVLAAIEEDDRPVLVVAEDLHWADPGSLLVLERWANGARSRAVGLIVTARPVPRRPEVDGVVAEVAARGEVIRLAPLDRAASLQVLADVSGLPLDGARPALAQRAAGHPFLLIELGRALAADPTAGERASDSLHRVVLARLARLSAPAQEALGLAAVLGPDLYLDDLRRLIDLRPLALDRIVRELLDAGVLRSEGPRLTFAHAIVFDAVYEAMPEPLRWAHHRELARSMAADGAPLELVAPHLMRGARPGDRAAVEQLVGAARRAMVGSAAAALPLWRRAVALVGPDEDVHWDAQAGLVTCLVDSGRVEEAADHAAAMLPAAPPRWRPELVGRRVQALIFQGRWAQACTTLAEVVAAAPAGPRSRTARAQLALAALQTGDLAEAEGLATDVLAEAGEAGDTIAAIRARAVLAQVFAERGCPSRADVEARQALGAAEEAGSIEAWEAQPHSVRVLTLTDLDQMDAAIDLAETGHRVYVELGSEVGQVRVGAAAAYAALGSGRWAGAVESFDGYWRIATRRGITPFGFTRSFRATLALAQDGPAAAREWLDDDRVPEPYRDHQWALAHAGFALALGDDSAALARLHAHWEAVTSSGRHLGQRLVGATLAHLAAEAGEAALVREIAATLAVRAAEEPHLASVRAIAGFAAALAEQDADRLHAAARALAATPRRYEAARVWSSVATASLRFGARDAARDAAHEALALWLSLDAGWAAQDLRSRLRREGVVIGSRGGRRRAGSGWAALSPAEERVARLVAEGWSNPRIAEHLVLSRRTVESHVARVLAKLGVASRTEVEAPEESGDAEDR